MALTARKSGRLGSLWLVTGDTAAALGNKIADIFDWTFEADAPIEDVSVKGDAYARTQPGAPTGRLRASAYVQTTANLASKITTSSLETPTRYAFKAWGIDNITLSVAGYGWLSRGSLNVPRGMIVDEIEITTDGEVVYA